jgi:SnoaL-like domain
VTLPVADRLALADLVHRYAAAIDDRRFAEATELFTTTAELGIPEPPHTLQPARWARGRDEVGAALSTLEAVTRTQHAIVGEVYTSGAEPGTARGRIACIAHHWTQADGQISDLVWHLRYADEYRLTNTGWLISRRALTIDAIETRQARRLRS